MALASAIEVGSITESKLDEWKAVKELHRTMKNNYDIVHQQHCIYLYCKAYNSIIVSQSKLA
jgi:hypothetical protein